MNGTNAGEGLIVGFLDFGADLPGGSSEQLYDSLRRLATLPAETIVCAGHDYGKTQLSTIGDEKAMNYTLAPRTKHEFVRFMQEP